MSLWMVVTDEKGVIWGAKGADDCGTRSIPCRWMELSDTDPGKDPPFEYDTELHIFAWWNRYVSGTISSEHPSSPSIDNRSSPYKDKPSYDRILKDMNSVETLSHYMKGQLARHEDYCNHWRTKMVGKSGTRQQHPYSSEQRSSYPVGMFRSVQVHIHE